jgi:hypothetical protein
MMPEYDQTPGAILRRAIDDLSKQGVLLVVAITMKRSDTEGLYFYVNPLIEPAVLAELEPTLIRVTHSGIGYYTTPSSR